MTANLMRWRSRSRSLGENPRDDGGGGDENQRACSSLTVWRKSLLFSCKGFTVIDCKGSLAYRVDNYIGRPGEIVLMDGHGKSILTVRRRKSLRLVNEWLIFEGEASHSSYSTTTRKQIAQEKKQRPTYYVKKLFNILQSNYSSNGNDHTSNALAHVYLVGCKAADHHHGSTSWKNKLPAYVIEGSYSRRSCKVLDCSSRKTVAEIKMKEAINGCASFGSEVFHLIVWPGFDPAFAMTLVLLLDRMFT